jgi:hypothetical protein
MRINGRKGRLSVMAAVRDERAAATAAGIDLTDGAAFRAWQRQQTRAFWSGLQNRVRPDGSMTWPPGT